MRPILFAYYIRPGMQRHEPMPLSEGATKTYAGACAIQLEVLRDAL
jgi:hypothetical protein